MWDLPVTIDFATDTAGFLIFHPEDLEHRWSDDLSWCYGDEFAVEARAGRLLGWETGSDGEWGIRLTDRGRAVAVAETERLGETVRQARAKLSLRRV